MKCNKCGKEVSLASAYEYKNSWICSDCLIKTDKQSTGMVFLARPLIDEYLNSIRDNTLRGLIVSGITSAILAIFLFSTTKRNYEFAMSLAMVIGIIAYFLFLSILKRKEKGIFKTGEILAGIIFGAVVGVFSWGIMSFIIAIIKNPAKIGL